MPTAVARARSGQQGLNVRRSDHDLLQRELAEDASPDADRLFAYIEAMTRALRFGLQLDQRTEDDPVGAAVRAQDAGFDVLLLSDHVGSGPAPLVTLAAIARETSSIRLGTLVLNNDMRNPVQLAWDAATLDRLSAGRFELGLGAGHTPQEYSSTSVALDTAQVRKARLAESIEMIRPLLRGDRVDYQGSHFQVTAAQIDPAIQDHLPILVGGNGAMLLAHAGAHADIIGLQGLARTRADGHSHAVRWDPAWLSEQVAQVRDGAGDRFADIEFNALVQVVDVTDDTDQVIRRVCSRIEGLTPAHTAEIPYILVGSTSQIVDKMFAARERWGISYFVVRELEAFAPVIKAARQAE